jgi:hypothetical protein
LFADSIIDNPQLTVQRYFYINLSRESIGKREGVNSVDTQQQKKWKSSDEFLGRKKMRVSLLKANVFDAH